MQFWATVRFILTTVYGHLIIYIFRFLNNLLKKSFKYTFVIENLPILVIQHILWIVDSQEGLLSQAKM